MQLLQIIISGVAQGCIYGLIALGFVLIYKATETVSFAQGDLMMVGAFIGMACMTFLGLGFFESLLIAMVTCSALGVVIERVAYKPLRNSTRIAALITAIGVSLLLQYTMMAFVGADVRTYPPLEP